MDCFAGLDVSTRKTAICVISNDGEVLLEIETPTEPAAISAALKPFRKRIAKVGHETGSLAPWLHKELQRAGLPIVCLEALHTRALLAGQRNKTDRNDALGIAQILRAGWYKTAHVKSDEAHRMRLLLAHRRALKRKAVDLENAVRHTLKAFGVRLHAVGRRQMGAAIAEATQHDPLLYDLSQAMLRARDALLAECEAMNLVIRRFADRDPVCKRLMTAPGVGPMTALAFRAAVDDPERFRRSRNVAAHFGLTPARHQSGEMDFKGRISKRGDGEMRVLLYEASMALLTKTKAPSWLKAWGLRIAKKRGLKRACVAVARRLATVLHRMWLDGTEFRWTKDVAEAT
jgi:transposase